MRPQPRRPLQYEDGVGGSQRGAPSSGPNTGNRRAGKRRHGKSPQTEHRGGRRALGAPLRKRHKGAAHLFDLGLWSDSGGQRENTGVRDGLRADS